MTEAHRHTISTNPWRLAVAAALVAASLNVFGIGLSICRADSPPEPADYRMEAYRAPTPASLAGAGVLTNEAAHELWAAKAAHFIDVLPRPPKPKDLPEGTIWHVPPRDNIPDSVWLPNVGFGALSPEMEEYFQTNLQRITSGDASAAIVIYCLADCWMSWNAAKRSLALGYRNVYWYPEGTDGWAAAGWPLQAATPVPIE